MSVVSVVFCQVEVCATGWSLVQPTVVRRWVWSRKFVNEKAMAHWGLWRQIKKRKRHPRYSTESHNALVSLFNHSVVIQDHNKISVTT